MYENTANAKRPNILWICTDQQRYDTLGCYGNRFVKTPNLDRLAQSGVRFNMAYSQSPVCTPSRASFLTGRYPRTTRCRQNGQSIPEDEVLVTKILADAGYNCGLSGKLHISACHSSVCKTTERRIKDGYSVFYWSHHPEKEDVTNSNWANNEYNLWLRENGLKYERQPYKGSKHVQVSMPPQYQHSTWCVNKAISFIEANASYENPWLFSVNIYDPHHAFDPSPEYLERYMEQLNEIPLPNYVEGELDNKPHYQIDEFKNGAYNNDKRFIYKDMTEYDHRLVRAAYWAMIDLIDEQVGRLLDSLEKTGQMDNTIVIFTSDHGEMLGDHGIYMKGPHFYDCSVRVPLIISYPGTIKQGVVSNALVELIDLAPTLLEAVGLEVYPGMQGKSMWDLLNGKSHIDAHRQDIMSEYYNAMPSHKDPNAFLTMLRNEQYKMVCEHGTDMGELYDMENDPNETKNLWYDESHANIKYVMLKGMCDRLAWTCDPLPTREARY